MVLDRLLIALALCLSVVCFSTPLEDPDEIIPETQNDDLLETRATVTIGLHRRPRSAESHARLFEWLGNTHKKQLVQDFVQDTSSHKLISQTTLKNADMVEYFGQVSVGGQNFAVVYDTGSGIFWVPGSTCKETACKNHEQLKPNKDVTIEDALVKIQYGTGNMKGKRAVSTVLVGKVQVKDQDFLVSTNENGDVFDQGRFDGVFGLGKSSLADILRQTGQDGEKEDGEEGRATPFYINAIRQGLLQKPMFSFYVSPGDKPGAVILGGTNDKLYTGPVKYHKGQSDSYWMMNVESIAAGDHADDEVDTSGAEHGLQGIADTGTSLLVVPEQYIGKIMHHFKVASDCSNMHQLKDLHIIMKDVNDELIKYTLTPEQYVMKQENQCETGIALMYLNLPGPHPAMIMGDTFLRSYYSIYNHANGQIGFANADHEHGEKIPPLI